MDNNDDYIIYTDYLFLKPTFGWQLPLVEEQLALQRKQLLTQVKLGNCIRSALAKALQATALLKLRAINPLAKTRN